MTDANDNPASLARKVCFVTIGATASFATLIRAVLSSAFFAALQAHHYTDLLVQYGADGKELYTAQLKSVQDLDLYSGITVTGFGLDAAGLGPHMRRAKGRDGGVEGVVVSHAGMCPYTAVGGTSRLSMAASRLWKYFGRASPFRPLDCRAK